MRTNPNILSFLALLVLLPCSVMSQESSSWADRINLRGDLRLRYEGIDEQGEQERNRTRYRARLALDAEVNSKLQVVLQLASGADNPVSRNVTFDGGFTTKDVGFDLVYVDWAVAEQWHIYAGKMKNPLFRAGGAALIWDSDLNPEGLAVKYSGSTIFATAASFSVEERSRSDDSILYAAQIGTQFDIAENLKLTAGVGYFGYTDTQGNEPFYNGRAKGNSVDEDGNYLYDYRSSELFAQLDTAIGGRPLSLFAQWVKNSEVSEQDTGYAVGANLAIGKASVGWTYEDIEADAVIGTFSDSDFGGGGTDATGHILKASYKLAKGVALGATYILSDVDRFQGTEHDYQRLQLDLQFSFR